MLSHSLLCRTISADPAEQRNGSYAIIVLSAVKIVLFQTNPAKFIFLIIANQFINFNL